AMKVTRQREAEEARRSVRVAEQRVVTLPAPAPTGSTSPPLRAKRPLDCDTEGSPGKRARSSEPEEAVVVVVDLEEEDVDLLTTVDGEQLIQAASPLDEELVVSEAGPLDDNHDHGLEDEDVVMVDDEQDEAEEPQPAVVLDEAVDGPQESLERSLEGFLSFIEYNTIVLTGLSLSAIVFWAGATAVKATWSILGQPWSGME
ncbi:hypothetical protein BGW38_008752, partial [Lunasporangiospora selenospora]